MATLILKTLVIPTIKRVCLMHIGIPHTVTIPAHLGKSVNSGDVTCTCGKPTCIPFQPNQQLNCDTCGIPFDLGYAE